MLKWLNDKFELFMLKKQLTSAKEVPGKSKFILDILNQIIAPIKNYNNGVLPKNTIDDYILLGCLHRISVEYFFLFGERNKDLVMYRSYSLLSECLNQKVNTIENLINLNTEPIQSGLLTGNAIGKRTMEKLFNQDPLFTMEILEHISNKYIFLEK